MALAPTLQVLNDMVAAKVIGEYAIGGAVAAFLYIEPGATFDLDIFIAWEPAENGLLDIGPIYADLLKRGYTLEGETVMVEDWPVQFLPPSSALVAEALAQALPITIEGVETRIFTAEHLIAICVQVGRPKDLARLVQFVEEGDIDETQLTAILIRHALSQKFIAFKERFFPKS